MLKTMFFAFSLFSCAVSADLIKVDFDGKTDYMWEAYKSGSSYNNIQVNKSNMLGLNFAIGEKISGYYVFNTSVAYYPYDHVVNDHTYKAYPAIKAWGYTSKNHSFHATQQDGYLAIYNNGLSDSYDAFYGSVGDFFGPNLVILGLSLWDRTGTLWNSLSMPKHLDLVDFGYAKISGSFVSLETGDQLHWDANIDHLASTNVSQVHEPSSMMLLATLFLILRRRLKVF